MSNILHDFTTTVPKWRPRVTPIKLEDATPDQLDALKVTPSNTKVSDYVLVLARDPETLRERTPLFNAALSAISGPMPAGSPMAMAIRGFAVKGAS